MQLGLPYQKIRLAVIPSANFQSTWVHPLCALTWKQHDLQQRFMIYSATARETLCDLYTVWQISHQDHILDNTPELLPQFQSESFLCCIIFSCIFKSIISSLVFHQDSICTRGKKQLGDDFHKKKKKKIAWTVWNIFVSVNSSWLSFET